MSGSDWIENLCSPDMLSLFLNDDQKIIRETFSMLLGICRGLHRQGRLADETKSLEERTAEWLSCLRRTIRERAGMKRLDGKNEFRKAFSGSFFEVFRASAPYLREDDLFADSAEEAAAAKQDRTDHDLADFLQEYGSRNSRINRLFKEWKRDGKALERLAADEDEELELRRLEQRYEKFGFSPLSP